MRSSFKVRLARRPAHYTDFPAWGALAPALREVLPAYEPVSAKAAAFHASSAKVRLLPGGNRSGKTTTTSKEAVDIIRAAPANKQGIALTDTYDNIGKFLWPHYKEWFLPSEWIWGKGNQKEENPKLILFPKNNFRLYFGSYEQKREALQGAGWWFVHFDEEPPKYVFDEVYRGTIDDDGQIFLSYTPLRGITYVTELLLPLGQDPTNSRYWAPDAPMSSYENTHLPMAALDGWAETLSEKSKLARLYGHAVSQEGLVYEEFEPAIHVCAPFPIPEDWTFYRAIDYGFNHPTVCLIAATDGETLYIVSEYYQKGLRTREHIANLKHQAENLVLKSTSEIPSRPYLITVADHDRQERENYTDPFFGDAIIDSEPANKDVIKGIERVESLLAVRSDGSTRFQVFNTCKHTIQEFSLYAYPGEDTKGRLKPEDKADHPLKEHDDCMDCVRYLAMEIFGAVEWDVSEMRTSTPDDIMFSQ